MQVQLAITEKHFDAVVAGMTARNRNDYYTTGSGRHNCRVKLTDEKLEGMLPLERKFTGQTYYHPHTAFINNGYTILEDGLGACYRTSGGNIHGVYNDESNYYAFYCGKRSRATDLLSVMLTTADKLEVVVYTTTGPQDMVWYETLSTYLIRKGSECAMQYFAKSGVVSDNLTLEEHIVLAHFTAIDPQFEKQIYATMLAGMDPETFILNTYRGKRIIPADMDPKSSAAWQLLSEEVQERILQWN